MSQIKKVGKRMEITPQPEKLGGVKPAENFDEVITLGQLRGYGGTATYRKYVALLTQSGVAVPTAVVLENTLGGTPTLGRPNIGEYTITLTGAFTANKTVLFITPRDGETFGARWTDANTITIVTYSGLSSDNILNNTTFEIRVYQ